MIDAGLEHSLDLLRHIEGATEAMIKDVFVAMMKAIHRPSSVAQQQRHCEA